MSQSDISGENELSEKPAEYVLSDAGEIGGDVDLSLLKDSLAKTPWERMLANDDAVNFAESLQAAMKARHAKLSGADAQVER